ncbi:MAG: hypothetical protein OXQ89_02600 [Rhodospirillaceae bacterium]|nr:hypothetical protein [Rhodospirillaceae bacterium]MDD9996616.1 hypothetical protein [Rhodospirillaceae bacterium]MDE0362989.1 hypothetical protein [Rhodospirillaceae bacterium]
MHIQRRQLWLVLLVETVFLGILAVWVLIRLDRLFEPVSLLVALAIIVISDVIAVVLMQAYAPTRITFSPGERELEGQVLDGFGASDRGRVLLRGEQWSARSQGSGPINPGDTVRVVSRRGLNLLVERVPEGASSE